MNADGAAGRTEADGRCAADIDVAADLGGHAVNGHRGGNAKGDGAALGGDAVIENDHADTVVNAAVVVGIQVHRQVAGGAGIGDGLIEDDGVGRLQRQRHIGATGFADRAVDGDIAQRSTRGSGGDRDVVATVECGADGARKNCRVGRRGKGIAGRVPGRPGRDRADHDVERIKKQSAGGTVRGRGIDRDRGHVEPVTGGFNASAVAAQGAAVGAQRTVGARYRVTVADVRAHGDLTAIAVAGCTGIQTRRLRYNDRRGLIDTAAALPAATDVDRAAERGAGGPQVSAVADAYTGAARHNLADVSVG